MNHLRSSWDDPPSKLNQLLHHPSWSVYAEGLWWKLLVGGKYLALAFGARGSDEIKWLGNYKTDGPCCKCARICPHIDFWKYAATDGTSLEAKMWVSRFWFRAKSTTNRGRWEPLEVGMLMERSMGYQISKTPNQRAIWSEILPGFDLERSIVGAS